MIVTRAQRALARAADHIYAVDAREKDATKKIYGGLCHTVPILVLNDGLCQTLAFIHEKATGGETARSSAYRLIEQHIAEALNIPADTLLTCVQKASVRDYMRATRVVLNDWVYYKRFAVSVLDVEAGQSLESP